LKLIPRNNQIRFLRRGLGLAQPDLAHLIGTSGDRNMRRFEAGVLEPDLAQALAMEVLFGCPVKGIFPKLRCKVEAAVLRRLRTMEARLLARAERKGKRVSKIVARLARIRAAIESRSERQANEQEE
jgi:DNA-binding XRE family transcriptional regulator